MWKLSHQTIKEGTLNKRAKRRLVNATVRFMTMQPAAMAHLSIPEAATTPLSRQKILDRVRKVFPAAFFIAAKKV